MKKLLKHYLIEYRPKGDDMHIFISEIIDKPYKKQKIKDDLAKIVTKKVEEKSRF